MATKKYTINYDEDLIKKVDAYAEQLHINRTAAMSVLLSQGLVQVNALDTLDKLIGLVNTAQESNQLQEKK